MNMSNPPKPTAPLPIVNKSGGLVMTMETTTNRFVVLINSRTGSRHKLHLPHPTRQVAASPAGTYIIAAGWEQLSLIQAEPPYTVLATVPISTYLSWVTVTDEALVVGVAHFGDLHSTLCVWQGETLQAGFEGEGNPLGAVAIHGLQVHGNQAVLWGVAGRTAQSGLGEPFVKVVRFAELGSQVVWGGEGLPFDAHGFVWPLGDGLLGAYEWERLVGLLMADPAGTLTLDLPQENLESVVGSPQGTHVAWYQAEWTPNEGDTIHLRVLRLADQAIVAHAIFKERGQFPVLAVDDEGQATFAHGTYPNSLDVYQVEGGGLTRMARLSRPF